MSGMSWCGRADPYRLPISPRSTYASALTSTATSVPCGGMPMATALPPQSRQSSALRRTAGWPTQSNAHVTPPCGLSDPDARSRSGGTSARTAAAASPDDASTKSVAPNCRPNASLAATVSTATIRVAPAMRRPWMTLRPTPPTPKTAAVFPGRTRARLSTAPTPVRTPQAMRQADVSGTSFGILTAWTSWTTVDSAKTDAAAKLYAGCPLNVNGVSMFPSDRRHWVGCPALHARQVPQLARVATTTWSPTLTERTSAPTASTTPAPSWPRTTGGGNGIVRLMTDRSEWQTPAAPIPTRTSLGPGSRTESSSVISTPSVV